MKELIRKFALVGAICLGALTGVAATGKTEAFPVDLREGDRVSAGTEELTFSNLWDGDAEANVTIAQDGAAIFTGLSGEGVKTWTVDRNGRYELTHTTYTNGAPGKVETAVFVVEGKEVPVSELTVEWETGSYKYDSNAKTPGVTAKNGDQVLEKGVDYTVHYEGNTNAGTAKAILTGLPPYVGSVTNEFAIAKRLVELTSGTASKPYDGTPLVCHSVTTNGDGFVAGEGVDFTFTGSQTIVGSSKNTFDYTFKAGTLAGNYTITKTEGDLIVSRADIVNPFDPDDPTNPATLEDLAKANCITNYDGDGHSIEVAAFLNPLIAANDPKITYSLLRDGTYEAQNPVFTNVVSTSVWYRIETDNFNLFTTNALLKILPRSITNVNVAAIVDQTYTGSGIEPVPSVTDMRTLIGMSEPTDILSGADYDLSYLNNTNVGTAKIVLSGKNNYDGSQTNAFQIVPAIIPPGPTGAIVAMGYTNAYDSAAHGVSVSAAGLKTQPTVQYKSCPSAEWQDDSPTYTDVCDTQVWWKVSAPNYQSVEGTIGLKITQAANVWTTEPAIDGWAYGETAKTPVGAAKFGEVAFAYDPMPVGAAGDYTMTATVAGTANYTGLSKTVDFTIAKAKLPDEEPGDGTVPEGGASKFDTVAMYDGEGHLIATNDLVTAFKNVIGNDFVVSYALGESGGLGQPATPWSVVVPTYTNVGESVVWYRVTSANYLDYVHEAKVAITNRPVTLASGTKLDFTYDGKPHAYTNLTVTAGGFVAGEGIATSNWATVAEVSEGQIDNTFEYEPLAGTILENYELTIVTGKIAVAAVPIPYLDWDGETRQMTNAVCTAYKIATAELDAFEAGKTYVVLDDVTVLSRILVNGSPANPTRLILCNDKRMLAHAGVEVADGNALIICGQANGSTGRLDASCGGASEEAGIGGGLNKSGGMVVINGGMINSWGGAGSDMYGGGAGIGGGRNGANGGIIVINGGYVEAHGGAYAAGIGGGSASTSLGAGAEVTINGGTVKAVGGKYTAGIGGGYTGASGTVTFCEGRTFVVKAGDSESGKYVTQSAYEDNHHSTYVYIEPGLSLKVPMAKSGYTYVVSNVTSAAVLPGSSEDGTNAYAVVAGETVRVYFAIVEGYRFVGEFANPLEIANITTDTIIPDDDLPNAVGTLSVVVFDAEKIYDGKPTNVTWIVKAYGRPCDDATICLRERGTQEWIDVERFKLYRDVSDVVVEVQVTKLGCEVATGDAKVTIKKRAIAIASVDGTWTYDTVAHGTNEVEIVEKVEGVEKEFEFPEGEGIEVDEASFPTITDVGERDNAFTWAFAEGTLAGNYAVTVKYGKLKVNARTIGDDDKNWDIRLDKAPMYNGKVQSAPIIQVCYVKPDGNLDYIPYELAGNTATDAGNYKVKISGKGNYSGTVEKDWAIMPRNLKMTSGTETWMYDGVTHSNDTVTVTGDGFVEGEGATYAGFPQVLHFADAAEPVENAFTYKLNDNTKAKNYEIVTEKGKVAMTRRPISLTAPTKSKTYDGTALTFAANDVTIDGEGYAEGEAFALSNFASITEAGQIAATFSIADGTALMDDYDITVTPGATLTVQKSATEITVTAKSKSWTYDGEPHELHEYDATNLGTLVAGDQLEVTFSADSVVTTPIDGEVENKIVSVKVLRTTSGQQQDVSDNYTLAAYPGTLKVTKRPVTLTSKGASKSYDGTALTRHEVEVGGDGFVGEDGATYTFSGSQLDKGKSKNAFEYSLKSGTNAAYYEITKVEGELEVFPADISAGTEEDWEIVLGPALTYNGIAQVQTVTSVKFKGLDLDYTVSGNQQTDAGNYELTLTGQGNFTGEKKVAWKLSPRPITITAKSVTRPYDGNVLMSWGSTTEGMVPGEDAGAMICSGNIKDVGSCGNAIVQLWWADNTKHSNYSVTEVAGTLTITPRPVTVTSKNITKPFDGTPLTLKSSDIYTEGIVIGEKFYYIDLASRTEAGQTSATFKIITLDNTKLTNYAITPVYGTITITKSATEIGVTARSKSWPYDATTHMLHEYDATNLNILQPGEELVVTFKEASKVTTPKDGPGEDGKVANEIESIRVVKTTSGQQQDVTANYTVTAYPGLLTVTKRPVTVTVEGETVSAMYDGEEHTASGYDIATEDELYDIAAKTSFGGTDEVTRTDAGKSEMGLKPSDFTNSDEYFDVTYAVTDGWVDIAQADISTGEEGDFVLTLGANPKYNGTVQTIPVTAVTYKELPVTYTLAGENATHAGTYTLTVKANGNFKGERSTTWKILKRQVKLTSGSASRAYNGQPLVNGDVTVSGDGFIGIEGATYSVTGSQTLAGSSKNAFAYTLKAGTQEGDYDIEKVEGDLVVTKAKYPGVIQWNVAADAATWMYDGQPHGVMLTGVPSGVTPHLTGNAAKDVGEYTASVTFDFDAANYEPPKAPASLKWSITARPLSLQTVNAEKPYDGFPLTVDKANITPGLSGYAEGECFDYFDLASITEVGETPATFKYRDSASAKVSNYAVSVVGGATLKVTVGGDQISVTARDGTWAYDATDHRKMEWDIVNGDKLLAGHEFRIKIDETKSVVKTPEDGPEHNGIVSNVFEYVKIVETETGADKTKNYNLFVKEGALQITNRVICSEELRVNSEEFTEKIEKTYDGEPTNVTVTAELLQPATVRYFGDKDCLTAPRGEGASGTVFTDAGEYVVWYTVAAQYYNTYTNKVEVKIDKRPITLTSPTKSKPFDGTALMFDGGEIEIGGDGYAEGEVFDFSDFASIVDAGRVDATFEYAAGADTSLDNYEVTVKKGTLTVNASAEEITVTAKSGSWPYDGEEHVLHDCEVENEEVLQSGDELVVEYLPASKVTTPDDGEVENVITSIRVMRGGEDGEDVTRNYSIKTYPGKIKVVNATIRSEELRVKSEECVYDGEGHTIGVEAVGLLTSPATVVYSATGEGAWKLDPMSVAVKNAGTHTIRYRVSAKFYNDYFGEATVKINPRPVTLLSGSATKTYDGTPLRKNEVKVKEGSLDFVDGEGVTTSCTSAQIGVGRIENGFNYEFKSGTLQDNYTIIPAFGWLEVTPGTLTVDPAKSGYNAPYDGKAHGPEVLAALSGLGFNPEACEITYALAPGDESAYSPTMPTLADVGTQTVYVKIKAQNFEVVYAEMTISVSNRPVTLTSGTKIDFTYDGKPHAYTNLTVTAGSFVAGEGIATSNWATVTTVAEGEVPNAFDYTPLAGTKLSNYDLTVITGKIAVVSPPASTVKVVLDAIGGKVQGKNVVTQEVNGVYGTLPDASRENYIFDGWFLGVLNTSPQAISGGAVLAEGDHTLFARWSYDPSVTPDPETIYKWEAIDANTARITGFVNANQKLQKMILPEKIGGRFVTEIGASAFANTECGVKELVLPMFCAVIDSKAFLGIETLETVTFAAARQWNDPSAPASAVIGTYAFSGAKALTSIMLCKEIASLGNYAFLNTRNLSSITILGKPTVGTQVFRSSGMDAGGVTIHLDPALASDAAYMAALKANMSNVTVKTDAIVTALTMSTLGMRGTSVRLTVSVEKAAEWGQVDLGAIRVKYRNILSDPATVLTPTAATRNADGTVTLEVVPPEGASGFFQTIIKR